MSTPAQWAVLIGIDFYLQDHQRMREAVNNVDIFESDLKMYFKNPNISKFVAVVTGDSGQTTPPGPPETWPTYQNITSKFKETKDCAVPGLTGKLIIRAVHALYSDAEIDRNSREQTRSMGSGFENPVGRQATLTGLQRSKAQVKLFTEASPQWAETIEESLWVEIISLSTLPSGEVPSCSVIYEDNKYSTVSVETEGNVAMPSVPSTDPEAISKI
ncbi:hypothetical protein F4810DRAFT_716908 [Camillea tinctor]|nr:hypothetical protein F4810DRAFT_716908 [Camillea tinctor]